MLVYLGWPAFIRDVLLEFDIHRDIINRALDTAIGADALSRDEGQPGHKHLRGFVPRHGRQLRCSARMR